MADQVIPDDVRDFILRHIDSVAQLEALLLLRHAPDETWEVTKVAARLYTEEKEVSDLLGRLCADGLLSCDDKLYRYAPATAEQRESVDRLAETYSRHLIPVTNMIHAKPRRIREFADAFRFRKER
jgi:hypothetical protein